jgi:prevent-host-death family protein
MDVGVRELKQHLSKYLKRAAEGETIRVTERGVPKAVLGPIPGRVRVEEGIAEGWISSRQRTTPAKRVRRATSRRRTSDVLNDDRDE